MSVDRRRAMVEAAHHRLSISAQYVGQVAGPLLGGFVGGHFGMRAVFLATAVLMALGALYNWLVRARHESMAANRGEA